MIPIFMIPMRGALAMSPQSIAYFNGFETIARRLFLVFPDSLSAISADRKPFSSATPIRRLGDGQTPP
jgi:hypothetical protein